MKKLLYTIVAAAIAALAAGCGREYDDDEKNFMTSIESMREHIKGEWYGVDYPKMIYGTRFEEPLFTFINDSLHVYCGDTMLYSIEKPNNKYLLVVNDKKNIEREIFFLSDKRLGIRFSSNAIFREEILFRRNATFTYITF
jgi:hypothetical protein